MTTNDTQAPPWDTSSNSSTSKTPKQPQRRKVVIKYKKPSTVLQVHIKPLLFEELKKTSEYLGNPTGFDFSMSIIARRALELYADHVRSFSAEGARAEAVLLFNDYR